MFSICNLSISQGRSSRAFSPIIQPSEHIQDVLRLAMSPNIAQTELITHLNLDKNGLFEIKFDK